MSDKRPKMESVERQNLTDQVYHSLKEAIIQGSLAPGTRLVEEQLASSLKVSKTPLREALGALERDGLIDAIPYQGRYVAFLSLRQIKELYDVRELLEGLVARLATEHITPELERELTECLEGSRKAAEAGNNEQFLLHDREFHDRLLDAADNQSLKHMLQLLRNRILLGQVSSVYRLDRRQESWNEHLAVLQALRDRDPAAAEAAMRKHIINLAATYAKQQQ